MVSEKRQGKSLIRAHYEGFKALLDARPKLAGLTHPSARLEKDGGLVRANYLVLFAAPPSSLGDERLTAAQRTDSAAVYYLDVKAVAVDPLVCGDLVTEVLSAVVTQAPLVAGRKCQPIEYDADESSDISPDTAVKPPLFYCDLSFILRSDRA